MASGRVPKTSITVFIMRVFGLLLLLGFPLNLYRPIPTAKRRQAKGRAMGHRPYRHKKRIIQLLLLGLRSKKGGGTYRCSRFHRPMTSTTSTF